MISDIFVLTGFGLIDPILAIFIKENLIGGTIFAAGLASMLFLITKSIVQLPFSKYVDSHKHKVIWLIIGTFIVSTIPFIYIFANHIYWIYTASILYGIGSGLAFPTWLGLWSTHLDRKHESFEWSIYSTGTGLGIAATAAVGGLIANLFGFKIVFLMTGLMVLIGCGVLFFLEMQDHKDSVKLSHYHMLRKHKNSK